MTGYYTILQVYWGDIIFHLSSFISWPAKNMNRWQDKYYIHSLLPCQQESWLFSGREYAHFQEMNWSKPIMKILVCSFSTSLELRSEHKSLLANEAEMNSASTALLSPFVFLLHMWLWWLEPQHLFCNHGAPCIKTKENIIRLNRRKDLDFENHIDKLPISKYLIWEKETTPVCLSHC